MKGNGLLLDLLGLKWKGSNGKCAWRIIQEAESWKRSIAMEWREEGRQLRQANREPERLVVDWTYCWGKMIERHSTHNIMTPVFIWNIFAWKPQWKVKHTIGGREIFLCSQKLFTYFRIYPSLLSRVPLCVTVWDCVLAHFVSSSSILVVCITLPSTYYPSQLHRLNSVQYREISWILGSRNKQTRKELEKQK